MISKTAAVHAVRRMCAFIPMMPQDDLFVAELSEELQNLASDEEQLAWIVSTARKAMPRWHSIADLRGLFCTRFAPADGFVNACTVPGFRPEDLENAFHAQEAAENEKRLLAYRPEATSALGEPIPFKLVEHSKMPGAIPRLTELEAALAAAPRRPRRNEQETERLIAELRSRLQSTASDAPCS